MTFLTKSDAQAETKDFSTNQYFGLLESLRVNGYMDSDFPL